MVCMHQYLGLILFSLFRPPGTPNALRSHPAAAQYKQAWTHCNETVRRSVAKVWLDQGLTRLRAFIADIVPEIQHEADLREAYVKDYDSYRRRFNSLQDKQVKYAAAPAPANGAPNHRLAEVEKALYQIQSKLHAAEDRYRRQNAKIKDEMLKAKLFRDELLETSLRTVLACQAELFCQTGEHLGQLLKSLPEEEKVESLRTQVKDLVAAGGPEARPVELSQMEKLVKAVTATVTTTFTPRSPSPVHPGAMPPASQSALDHQPAQGGQPTPVTNASQSGPPKSPHKPTSSALVASGGGVNGNSEGGRTSGMFSSFFSRQSSRGDASKGGGSTTAGAGMSTATGYDKMGSSNGAAHMDDALPLPMATAAPPNSSQKPVFARALYDNEAEDETELAFMVGDVIEILAKDDSGWWDARLNGKVGSIPANYVEVIP